MATNPPFKTLGASVFNKYSNFIPKSTSNSPRQKNLVKSAVDIQKLRNLPLYRTVKGKTKRDAFNEILKK